MSGNVRDDGIITAAGRGQSCLPTAEKNAQLKKIRVSPALACIASTVVYVVAVTVSGVQYAEYQ
jgi:hypothetical protein